MPERAFEDEPSIAHHSDGKRRREELVHDNSAWCCVAAFYRTSLSTMAYSHKAGDMHYSGARSSDSRYDETSRATPTAI